MTRSGTATRTDVAVRTGAVTRTGTVTRTGFMVSHIHEKPAILAPVAPSIELMVPWEKTLVTARAARKRVDEYCMLVVVVVIEKLFDGINWISAVNLMKLFD